MSSPCKTLELFNQLLGEQSKNLFEWSYRLTNHSFSPRFKPTLYLFPEATSETYSRLYDLLPSLDCPHEVLSIQEKAFSTAIYQGIRIPVSNEEEKCLFIHEEEEDFIHSYKWLNQSHYRRHDYFHKNDKGIKDIRPFVHERLKNLLDALDDINIHDTEDGIWLQSHYQRLYEVYLTFPSRPQFSQMLQALQNHLPSHVYTKASEYAHLRYRNIGFDTTIESDPALNIYFSTTITNTLPNDYLEQSILMNH